MRSFVLAVLVLVAGVWAAEEDDQKLGSRGNPITISSVDELIQFREAVEMGIEYKEVRLENGGAGLHFKLTKDLDLSSVCGPSVGNWKSIGPFNGSFDGGNHTISNLYMDDSHGVVSSPGFFGVVLAGANDTSYFENVKFTNVKVRTSQVFGTVVSQIVSGNAVIRNVSVDISFQNASGADFQAGGILGNTVADWVELSHNTVKGSFMVTDFASSTVGGIIGVAVGSIDLISNTNEAVLIAKGDGDANVGGIAGQMLTETVMTGNTNKGNITVQVSKKTAYAGGLVGIYPSSEAKRVITGNTNSGFILVTANVAAEGGLFGYILGFKNLTLDSCVNNGDVTYRGTGSEKLVQVGGIAGIWETMKATRMINNGAITVENAKSPYVGGLIGFIRDGAPILTLANSVNEGEITLTGDGVLKGWVGGLIGATDSLDTVTLEKCENRGELKIVGEKDADSLFVEENASVPSGTTLLIREGSGGDNPGGDNPGGDNPGGDNPGGDNPGGDNPGGDNPGGDNPGGDNPGGDNPGGDNPGGDNPGGDKPGDQKPGGDNPGGKTGIAVQQGTLEMHLFRDGDRLALEIPGLARGERAQVAVFSLEGKRMPVNVTRSGSTFYMDGSIAAGRYIVRAVTPLGSKSFVTIF